MHDTFVIQQQAQKQAFLDHINSIDPIIMFTVEGHQQNGAIPFLDTLVTPEADNSLSITMYCKPIHTDQYLQWDSHHNLSTKFSVIGTLTHRSKIALPHQSSSRRKYNTLGKPWSGANTPTGPSIGHKVNIINSNQEDNNNHNNQEENNTQDIHNPVQTQKDPHTSWILTIHKAPTIQAQTQKNPPPDKNPV